MSEQPTAERDDTDNQRLRDRSRRAERIRRVRSLENAEETRIRRAANASNIRTRRATPLSNLYKVAFAYDCNTDYAVHDALFLGLMNNECSFCNARKFKNEASGLCCNNGKVKLPELPIPPEPLNSLINGNSAQSNDFLNNIRAYNSCFSMTSFGAKDATAPGWRSTFRVEGQIYHRIGSLQPLPNEQHQFLQLYFIEDQQVQALTRNNMFESLKLDTILQIQNLLHDHNIYVRQFKSALELAGSENIKVVIRADKTPAGEHPGRYNAPCTNEVALLMVGEETEKRDIVLHRQDGNLQKLTETHRAYDTLQYPLIFWQGTDGYHFLLKQNDPYTGEAISKKLSAQSFYAYRLMVRSNSCNYLLKFKQLLNQYMVDMYAKIESERLLFIKLNQKKLRADDYIHLRDALQGDGQIENTGQLVILPSTFTGGPRYMHEKVQDALTYVRHFGKPDLFITFTTNPSWPEIHENLLPTQYATDRHDIIARVFKLKIDKLLELIRKEQIFGPTRCYMYSIEWQKRGLPHMHLLLWLIEKIHPNEIDKIISAELPDPSEDPMLFDIVKKNMIHGPCGQLNPKSPCMVNKKCLKHFPKDFVQETQMKVDGYPNYRRRMPYAGGISFDLERNGQKIVVDNKWVVPYSPFLCKAFNAHINVEFCNSVKSIKYVCKYINKGSDQAIIAIDNTNEVEKFLAGRYISSNEAAWRIFSFDIHSRYPSVQQLSVHLENGQRVYYTEENAQRMIDTPKNTTLMAFFNLCKEDEFASTITYPEVLKYYTFKAGKFQRRKQGQPHPTAIGIKCSDVLGRVYTVHPRNSECFFLRLLLHHVKGPRSFQDLKTINGNLLETYREACIALGLAENDHHWDQTLEDAAAVQAPKLMRDLFAVMIATCELSNPKALWEKHKESLTEDFLQRIRIANPGLEIVINAHVMNLALCEIEDKVVSLTQKCLTDFGLPSSSNLNACAVNRELLRETSYKREQLIRHIETNEPLLKGDQREVYNEIISRVNNSEGGVLFLDAPGGTGKTFVINLLLSAFRLQGKVALAVASSGIAATMLYGGRTAHSTFKLPLQLNYCENPVCSIKRGTNIACLLQVTAFIVWDECTMAHKYAFEALDRTLRDIRKSDKLMGGITVLLSGDFRQTLPVITRGTVADEVQACLKSSYLWPYVERRSLTTNMRVELAGERAASDFAGLLLKLGNGEIHGDNWGEILIPDGMGTVVLSEEELIANVYPNIAENVKNTRWLCERAILAPRNETVKLLNLKIMQHIQVEEKTYLSVDNTVNPDQAVNYPAEFLNSLDLPGLPPHKLVLKRGVPIMLLRNLNPPKLCNGTRLIVNNMLPHLIEAVILTGQGAGETVLLPRIPMVPVDTPFEFKRLQYPVRLSFAMSINKSQGQSLKFAGLHLLEPCFSHGQFYVGCSRVGDPSKLFIFAPNGKTKNVVYSSILQ